MHDVQHYTSTVGFLIHGRHALILALGVRSVDRGWSGGWGGREIQFYSTKGTDTLTFTGGNQCIKHPMY